MTINNNILLLDDILGDSNPNSIMLDIAQRVKERRLELNFTQNALAKRSGVNISSYRRFETTGEIALKSLVQIAIALDSTEEFFTLFVKKKYQSLDEIIATKEVESKKRGRINE